MVFVGRVISIVGIVAGRRSALGVGRWALGGFWPKPKAQSPKPLVVVYEGYAPLGVRGGGRARRRRRLDSRREDRPQARSAQPVVLGAALRLHAPAIPGGPARSGGGAGRGRIGAWPARRPDGARGRRDRRLRVAVVDEEEGGMANEDDLGVIGAGTGA